jgi:hypothetical protein
MKADPQYTDVFVEVGVRGKLDKGHAMRASKRLKLLLEEMPTARFCVMIGGFDHDPREVWDIPQARDYVMWLALYLMDDAINFTEINLHPDSMAVFALCTGVGRITKKHDHGYTVEIGEPLQ